MKKLQCELCGGTLLMDDNGNFASCESCGMKFSRDTIKRMIVEISGPVQVEGIANIDNLLARARDFEKSGEIKKAIDYYNRVLDLDLNNPEAKQRYHLLAEPLIEGDITQVYVIRTEESDFNRYSNTFMEKIVVLGLPSGRLGLIKLISNNKIVEEHAGYIFNKGDVFDAVVVRRTGYEHFDYIMSPVAGEHAKI